jgi:two-component system NtrC family sensor kinase
MRTLPGKAQIYVIFVWIAAATLLGTSLLFAFPRYEQLLLVPIWTIVYVIADYFEVEFGFEDGKKLLMTVYEAVIIFLIPVSGIHALLAIMAGALLTDALHQRKWYRSLFNASERVITYASMWAVYQLFAPASQLPFVGPQGIFALLATVSIYYVLNTLLISTILALVSDQSIIQVIREAYLKVHWVHFLTLPLGAVLATLWFVDRWLVLAGVVPLIMAQRSFKALAAWQVENTRNISLARQVEQLQEITTAMVTSLNPAIVLDTISVRLAALLQAGASWVVLLNNSRPQIAAVHGVLPAWAEPVTDELAASRPLAITQFDQARLLHVAEQPGPRGALAAIPMALEGRVLGYICLVFSEPVELGQGQQRVFQAFAAQAALVIEHAHLFDALQHKQSELVRSSKLAALGTFSAGIAHEFNNILAGILGYAQLGRTSDDREEQRESLEIIEQSCIRARGITSGLLAFARRRAPQRRLSTVHDAVDAALVLIERELLKANIVIERRIEPTPPTICDNDQLAQVVLNLLTNARDAMLEKGGGTITVSLAQRNRMIELQVADSGCGIPAELLDQIFQPFMTTKGALGGSSTPGTGLGLAISYGIIESHNGTIDVDSQVGVGTRVTIRLPIVDQVEETSPKLASSTQPNSLRILAVDDDPQVLSALQQLLTRHGHRVQIATTGAAAIERYGSETFDLVLSDVVMPGMDGFSLLLQLRESDPNVRLIAMTGQPGTPQVEQMIQAGALGPLNKPFTIDELLTLLAQHVSALTLVKPPRPLTHRVA